MTDREKVTKGLEHCVDGLGCFGCPYHVGGSLSSRCVDNIMRDTLDMIKKLEPHLERDAMKPEVERSGGGSTWWNVCGACKTAINPNDKYCHECGVSIDWGRDNA